MWRNKTPVVAAAAEASESPARYYQEGAIWEQNISRRNRVSRSLAWCVAGAMTLIATGAVAALVMALPLRTYEPYMIVVDKSSGFVEVKRPLAEGALQQDEAIAMADLVRYVRARETYDPHDLKANFELAQLLSTGDASAEYRELFSPANPKNLVKIFGRNTLVSVNIKSVTFPNQSTALVRFASEEKTQTGVATRNWVSLIRFRYSRTPATNELRFQNPLGFQVVSYRRDQETAPSPGTVPTPAPGVANAPANPTGRGATPVPGAPANAGAP